MSPRPVAPHANERGIALIMALLTLLVLSLAVAGIMMSLNSDTQWPATSCAAPGVHLAEAGIAEPRRASARRRAGRHEPGAW
jgi:Tfp pilus assembly protein PilX